MGYYSRISKSFEGALRLPHKPMESNIETML